MIIGNPIIAAGSGGGKDHTFDVPTIGTLTYNGNLQSILSVLTGYYGDFMTISGTSLATNAGTYTAIFSLKDTTNCQWRDGSTTPKNVSWTIAKAVPSTPVLTPNTLNLNTDTTSATFTVTRDGNGTITATPSNQAITTTIGQDGVTVTVTLVDTTVAVGSVFTVDINVAGGDNYLPYVGVCQCIVNVINVAAVLTVTGLGNEDPSTVVFTEEGTFDWSIITEETVTINGIPNYFIKIPTMYRKVNTVTDNQITSFSISTAKIDNNYEPYPCFVDGNNILGYVYIGKYCVSDKNVANSVNAGLVPQTLKDGRNHARALGIGYQLYDWQLQKLFVDLAMMKAQTVNFNSGSGISEYLGIAHLNASCWVDGVYHNNTTWYVALDPDNYTSDTSSRPTGYYALSYAAPTGSGTEVKSLGYVNNNPFANLPSSDISNSSMNTYYCDAYYYTSGNHPWYSLVGYLAADAGLWLCSLVNYWSDSYGVRLCYRPISS